MTLKEEAKELVRKFELRFDVIDDENYTSMVGKDEAKQCALICVDKLIEYINNSIKSDGIINHVKGLGEIVRYRELKQEIEKL